MKTVAFCTSCKGRAAHVKETLPPSLAQNTGAVHVLLDYNSKDGLGEWVFREMQDWLAQGKLAYYRFTEPTPFRMAHAKNLAHRLGILEGADILVNVDADNFACNNFADYVRGQMANGDCFLWSRMVKEGPNKLPRGISGRIAVSTEHFWLTGGYDEKYNCWGPDDKDFNTRLRRLGLVAKEIDPRYLNALSHNDKMRFREYPQTAHTASAEEFEVEGLAHTRVVNGGRAGLGVVYKNFQPAPIVVGPFPTRILGIGMHKTGTTTLAKAIRMLGISCEHWPSAHWAKAVWTEMSTTGLSPTLEQQRAATDLPMPLLFRELDRAYPGSKFILTVRDERKWLESVRTHFSSANPFRVAWDTDPFTHKVHLLLYGRRGFDEQVMLERYRRHNTEVREYFRGRPQDLLEFNIDTCGWPELCGFLAMPLVMDSFPRENVS